MKTMTPYSLAFSVYRIIAVFLLAVGIWTPFFEHVRAWAYGYQYSASLLNDLKGNLLDMVVPAMLLYFVSPWLAKLTTLGMGKHISN